MHSARCATWCLNVKIRFYSWFENVKLKTKLTMFRGCFSATHRATVGYLSQRGCQAGSTCSFIDAHTPPVATAGPGDAAVPLEPSPAVLPAGWSQARKIFVSMRCWVHDWKLESSWNSVEMFMFHLQGQVRPFDIESAWSIDGSLGLPKNWSHPSPGSVNFVDAQSLFPHLRKARCMLIV